MLVLEYTYKSSLSKSEITEWIKNKSVETTSFIKLKQGTRSKWRMPSFRIYINSILVSIHSWKIFRSTTRIYRHSIKWVTSNHFDGSKCGADLRLPA